MGKKTNNANTLGRAIINARDNLPAAKRKRNNKSTKGDEINQVPIYDDPQKNMFSITEQNSLDDFLTKAELAGTEFTAERMNVSVVDVTGNKLIGVLNRHDEEKIKQLHEQYKNYLTIPRRPKWSQEMSAEELQKQELDYFLQWRRKLAELEEVENIVLTPFERNIEIWRQLWRVLDRSDVVVQILDARNPLLFRSEDLEAYVRELNENKINVLLLNKSDLLNEKQRKCWVDYFNGQNIRVVFWSALETQKNSDEKEREESESEGKDDEEVSDEEEKEEELKAEETNSEENNSSEMVLNTTELFSRDDLIEYLKNLRSLNKFSDDHVFTVGMVGYPNVGKSSTINKLMSVKKVAVSATPGKTKHFQTLFIDDELMLCDCPGLVMPSFAMSKAQMIVSSILSADQMRDYNGPISLICSQIPRYVFERIYGVTLPKPDESAGEDPRRPPTVHELLTTYAFVRGFMSPKGIPDWSRAARVVVKDYISGKLRYCTAPPTNDDVDQSTFNDYDELLSSKKVKRGGADEEVNILRRRHLLNEKSRPTSVDDSFFRKNFSAVHVKTSKMKITSDMSQVGGSTSTLDSATKPPKKLNKNVKKDKLRRIYKHLDV